VYLAHPLAQGHLAGEAGISIRSLLRTKLEHAPVSLHRFSKHLPLFYAHAQRFLHVHVLARTHGLQRRQHVPMVGRGNYHRIDIVAGAEFPEVVVGCA